MPPRSAKHSFGTLAVIRCGIAWEDLLTTATAALLNFALFLNRNIRKNETLQAIETAPRSRIHRGPSGLSSFAVWSTGLHINNTIVPSAKQLTTTKSRILLKNAGPPQRDRRRNHNNTSPANHSTGVFRNHSWGGCAPASPGFGAQKRIKSGDELLFKPPRNMVL